MLGRFEFDLVGPPIDESAITNFEKELGGKIDDGVRKFLKVVNGGVPTPALTSSISQLMGYEIIVFYKLAEGYCGLRRRFCELQERLPLGNRHVQGLLPVAGDTGNRDICISVGRRRSPIYLVAMEPFGNYDAKPPTVEKIAGDWREFVQSLSQTPDITDDVEELAKKEWSEIQHYLDSGGDPNAVGRKGLSLLCQAIRHNNVDAVHGLLARDANLTGALEMAVTNKRDNIVRELVAKGCKPEEGLPFAVGPQRRHIRAYLRSLLRDD